MFKLLTEIIPLIVFFVCYKINGIFSATLYMLIASIITITLTYILKKRISNINLVSTLLLLTSGSLTLLSGNTVFIKLKPTILYISFVVVFLVTGLKKRPAIKYMLESVLNLEDEKKWQLLNTKFMWFFFIMAIFNEVVWRNFSEEFWINFKIFGAIPIALLFLLTQIPLKNLKL